MVEAQRTKLFEQNKKFLNSHIFGDNKSFFLAEPKVAGTNDVDCSFVVHTEASALTASIGDEIEKAILKCETCFERLTMNRFRAVKASCDSPTTKHN